MVAEYNIRRVCTSQSDRRNNDLGQFMGLALRLPVSEGLMELACCCGSW